MQNKAENKVNAGFFVRLAAYLIDCLIVGTALLLIRIPITISVWTAPDHILVRDLIFQYSLIDITYYLLSAAYFVCLTYFTGATVGKKLLHLRVVSVEDRKLTFFEVAFRETVGRFLSKLVINVGYFMIGIHKEKWGLHDMLSDTEVIYFHEKKIEIETPVAAKEMSHNPNVYTVPTYMENKIEKNPKTEETVCEEYEIIEDEKEVCEIGSEVGAEVENSAETVEEIE